MKATVKPNLLVWARQRAGLSVADLQKKFPKYADWESGVNSPTFKQIQAFADKVHVPIGQLFLQSPPVEELPIPDFRTVGNKFVDRPSTELIDTIHACQHRQEWYRYYAHAHGLEPIEFIDSLSLDTPIKDAANRMHIALKSTSDLRQKSSNSENAMRILIERIEDTGVLVMINGVVNHNTSRTLNSEEFRGFALVDKQAPVIFINGQDYKSAQMFTLAHELAHLFLGETALSDASAKPENHEKMERWCNAVAGEFLVRSVDLAKAVEKHSGDVDLHGKVARTFKVSRPVALRRMLDEGHIQRQDFDAIWEQEYLEWCNSKSRKSSGGNFFNTALVRNSKRFTNAIMHDTLAGQTLYRDAFHLLAMKPQAFDKQAKKLGISA